ncbi:MAG TPA: hypothetical protein PLS66_00780 [Tepiditoga sp.]|nr:amidase [Thermotogota bacterium]HOO73801.1 hypothetical protein [Tepiditoga sp.]
MEKNEKIIYEIYRKQMKAHDFLGSTIEKINYDVSFTLEEKKEKYDEIYLFGVKNTASVGKDIIKKLSAYNCIFNTIDKMSDGGRAVDAVIRNPVNGNMMTGSSSASAVNVLYGINDFAIATDGGGSVLAPAFSLNLFSCLLKGIGYKSENTKKSTDGIDFTAGTGIIAGNFKVLRNILNILAENTEKSSKKIRAAIPGNIVGPDGIRQKDILLEYLKDFEDLEISEYRFPDFRDRRESIEIMEKIFKENDVVATVEGPVDVYGTGDSVYGNFYDTADMQAKSGKYMVKIANMLNCSSLGIPLDFSAKGILLSVKEGMENFSVIVDMAEKISEKISERKIFENYFLKSYLRRKNEYFFRGGE